MILNFSTKYKSRKGEDVEICTLSGPDKQHPVVVAYQNNDYTWRYGSVTENGREFVTEDSLNDIVTPKKTVRRVLEVTGYIDWVDKILEKSTVKPGVPMKVPNGTITEVGRTTL